MSGQSKQDKRKAEKRLADMALPPARPAWYADWESSDRAWDEEEVIPFSLSDHDQELQVVQRTRRHPQSGKLVDFCVSLQARDPKEDKGWYDIERVDSSHGFVHVDRYAADGTSVKDTDCVPPKAREELDAGFVWALNYVWDIGERLRGWT